MQDDPTQGAGGRIRNADPEDRQEDGMLLRISVQFRDEGSKHAACLVLTFQRMDFDDVAKSCREI